KYIPAKILFFDGEVIGILAFMIGGLIWFLIPFLSRSGERPRTRLIFNIFGVVVVLYIVVMTIVGFLA
ncbi:MAG TPA: hypothetical protein VJ180_10615, partial [Pyrinomonadaceae bacterium]|nr:hypothetical protein [Pyrinomonadaceae bacterium]